MNWLQALKMFNKDHKGTWCIPKKDTPEYKTVVDIMNGKHMRRQEEIQGSGFMDHVVDIYNKSKAKKDKDAARIRQIQDDYRARKAAEKATASPPVVGSGRRGRGRPKGSKNKVKKGGNIFKDIGKTIGKTVDVINPFPYIDKELKKIKVS